VAATMIPVRLAPRCCGSVKVWDALVAPTATLPKLSGPPGHATNGKAGGHVLDRSDVIVRCLCSAKKSVLGGVNAGHNSRSRSPR